MIHRTVAALSAAALIVAAAPAGPAGAASETGKFRVRGVGAETCRDFTQAYSQRTPRLILFGGWLEGYLSATNRYREKTFDSTPWQSSEVLLALLNNHCAANPDDQFQNVVQALLGFFREQSLSEASTPVEAVAGEHKIQVYREVMRRAQEALAAAGHYNGIADGLYGPKTRAAFEAFQAAKGLAKTGIPDQRTLVTLFGVATGN